MLITTDDAAVMTLECVYRMMGLTILIAESTVTDPDAEPYIAAQRGWYESVSDMMDIAEELEGLQW